MDLTDLTINGCNLQKFNDQRCFQRLKKIYWYLAPEAPTDSQIQVVDGQVLIYDKNIENQCQKC